MRTNKMMDAPDGRTMSKTKGNGINLADDAKTMFGKAMSYPDTAILSGFELLTDISMEEIDEMKKAMDTGENPMTFKKKMAFEIVKELKGEAEAKEAEEYFVKTFSKKEIPENIPEFEISAETKLTEVLVGAKVAGSLADARRKIEQGGVEINGERVTDWKKTLSPEDSGVVVKVGKKDFLRLS